MLRKIAAIMVVLALLPAISACSAGGETEYRQHLTTWVQATDAIISTSVTLIRSRRQSELASEAEKAQTLYQQLAATTPPARYAAVHAELLGELRHLEASDRAASSGDFGTAAREAQIGSDASEAVKRGLERIVSGAQ